MSVVSSSRYILSRRYPKNSSKYFSTTPLIKHILCKHKSASSTFKEQSTVKLKKSKHDQITLNIEDKPSSSTLITPFERKGFSQPTLIEIVEKEKMCHKW